MLFRRLVPLALAGTLALTACGDTFRPPAAVVNGASITDHELETSIPLYRFLTNLQQRDCGDARKGEPADRACTRFVLSELIQEELVGAYARSHDLSISETEVANALTPLEQQFGGVKALRARLAKQGLSYPDLRGLAARLLLIQKVAGAVALDVIPESELRRQYQQQLLQFTRIHVTHILVKRESLARRISREVNARNFAELARRYSIDPGSASSGGDLGTTVAAQFDGTFVNAALQLRPGQIGAPVHTQFGWHIIRLISVEVTPFEQAKPQLASALSNQAFATWLRQQVRDGGIDVNPRYGDLDPASGLVLPITSTPDA